MNKEQKTAKKTAKSRAKRKKVVKKKNIFKSEFRQWVHGLRTGFSTK
jgi:hypothetical protein